ncbi:MAG: disulfide bond formation protein B [Micavibrio sp.]
MIKNLLSHPVFVPMGLFFTGIGALGSAFIAQYVFGLAPCPLCIWQRWPYAAIVILGLIGIVMGIKNKPKGSAAVVALASLAFLVGGIIAFYHVGVEQHWWKSMLEGCAANFSGSAADLLKQIESTVAARCDQIPWSLFGISMAGYNAIISLIAAPITLVCALLITRRANGL